MGIISTSINRGVTRLVAVAIYLCVSFAASQAFSASGDRELYLYYTHTRETARIVFKRNGRYDQAGLDKLNYFLRDWRRNEPTKMDPALFDLIWTVYQEVGATKPVNVVSAYRAPETNEMLRSTSSGVAKNSRHTMGMAMDFFIPGIALPKLREVAMRHQIGGVGFYPTSGSPFVHLDTGNVRAWPRMTHTQLAKLFPDGKTLHIPTDGKLLSQDGYNYAKKQWLKCHSVPCTGGSNANVRVASANTNDSDKPKGTVFGWLFGNEGDEDGEEADAAPVAVASVKTIAITPPATAPVPMAWPSDLRGGGVTEVAAIAESLAPTPLARPDWLDNVQVASAEMAVEELAPVPAPRHPETGSAILTAYAPTIEPEKNAQLAVTEMAERMASAKTIAKTAQPESGLIAKASALAGTGLRMATLDTGLGFTGNTQPVSRLANKPKMRPADVALVAPDFNHLTDMFSDPASISSDSYAFINNHVSGGLESVTQLGSVADKMHFGGNPGGALGVSSFRPGGPMLVASR